MRSSGCAARSGLAGLLAISLAVPAAAAPAKVRAVYSTAERNGGNVDSCAVWSARDLSQALLFATEKDGDRIDVFLAQTGEAYAPRPFLGGVPDGSAPGQLNRPNGVWVLYHVPVGGGFADVLLVTDQLNLRVQAFRLPGLEYFGAFGEGEVGKGYGLAPYQDGTDYFVFITDNSPPATAPGKVKRYRLRPEGPLLGADLAGAFGSAAGPPPLPNVESIVADVANDRLHVCGDEGGKFNRVFRLDGTYTGIEYGDPQFEFDQEGIVLYDTGGASGYLVVSDQHTDGTPNEFEVFDRESLASLGNFVSRPDGPVTRNTDGDYLEQRPLPGFPNGGFFAVNDDRSVHAYDWTDIAEAIGLEVVALDREFPGEAVAGPIECRRALWFRNGSWWAALVSGATLELLRLEDGVFSATGTSLGEGAPAEAWAGGDDLLVLACLPAPRLHRFAYRPALRRYEPRGTPVPLPVGGPLADLAVEPGPRDEAGRVLVLGIAGGVARAAWSGLDGMAGADLSTFQAEETALGGAAPVRPRLARMEIEGDGVPAVAAAWVEADGSAVLRIHRDVDGPGTWSPPETIHGQPVEAVAITAGPGATLLTAGSGPDGAGWLRRRFAGGTWGPAIELGEARLPALVVDEPAGVLHLIHIAESAGHRTARRRQTGLDDLAALSSAPPQLAIGWPGVSAGSLVFPRSIPDVASELVAVSEGDDAFGRFARIPLGREGDRQAPVTLQHSPPPGASGLSAGDPLRFRITDDRSGVDRSSLRVLAGGAPIAWTARGSPRNLLVSAALPAGIAGPTVRMRIEASDLSVPPRVMTPFEYDLVLGPPLPSSFRRGDANGDGTIDLADAVNLLFALFLGDDLSCREAADAGDDGALDLTDAVFLLDHLYRGGAAPPAPGADCGPDPTPDDLGCSGPSACQ